MGMKGQAIANFMADHRWHRLQSYIRVSSTKPSMLKLSHMMRSGNYTLMVHPEWSTTRRSSLEGDCIDPTAVLHAPLCLLLNIALLQRY